MSDREILEKAIQKAVDGGWDRAIKLTVTVKSVSDAFTNDGAITPIQRKGSYEWENYAPVIFSKDFAKALWGEELHSEEYDSPIPRFPDAKKLDVRPHWQYHLQAMVISDEPIKYLGDNI